MSTKDSMGDRLKAYEMAEAGRKFMPLLPIYARLDGRSFSKFTKDMKRPFDERFSKIMMDITKFLVKETNARIGYVQSDEISLVWLQDSYDSEVIFNGRIQKMTSVLPSMASAKMMQLLMSSDEFMYEKANELPAFDCRVFQLPNKMEAANTFLWREMDATKNAVSMAARSMFSHNSLQNKTGKVMQEMMFQEKGVNFNDYPDFFKRGSFFRRKNVTITLTEEDKAKLPFVPENGEVIRTIVDRVDVGKFNTVSNRVGFIFDGEEPIYIEE